MKPLILNHAEPMARVRIITTKDASEKTLKTLHKIGVIHVEEAKELKPADRTAIDNERKEVSELLSFISTILSYLPEKKVTFDAKGFEVLYTRPFKEISDEVRLLYGRVNSLKERISKIDTEVQKLKELKKYLAPLAIETDLKLGDLNYTGEFLISRVFILSSEAFKNSEEKFKKYLFARVAASLENEVILHVVAEARDENPLQSLIADAGGRVLQVSNENLTVGESLRANDIKINDLEASMTKLKQELEKKAGEDAERLVLLREALSAENERLSVLDKAAEARYVTLIEGWVPQKQIEDVTSGLRQEIDYIFIDSRPPEDSEQPPTKLDNSMVTKPFQVIVDLFGTPKYREWDPTPIVAYSFAFFFGIMTQDVIYAIGIMLAAKFLLPKFVENTESEGFKLFQRVLYIGAGVGLVIGLLTGSYLADFSYKLFGFKMPALPAVAQLFSSPTTFIIVAVLIGFVHVNIAHIFALIIALKTKNKGVIITKSGFFAFQIFVVLFAISSLLKPNLPLLNQGMAQTYLYGMYGSLAILIAGVIMQNSYFGVLLWIFEITGLLGDTLSYSRLAGVALAGFYLGSAINLMATIFRGMIPGPVGLILGTIVAFFVLVAGHLINTLLCIQGGFIHSLRLCLVEFMFKFYEGGGTKYNPFSLKTGKSLIIKEKT